MSSHPRLTLLLRFGRTLSFMRRLAFIAVGAAVAALLLLPAAASWLRQPAPAPLPDPVNLQTAQSERRDARAGERRVRTRLLSRPPAEERTVRQRPATERAQAVLLAPVHARGPSRTEPNDDEADSDNADDAEGDDEPGEG